jgi:hypothetical protein
LAYPGCAGALCSAKEVQVNFALLLLLPAAAAASPAPAKARVPQKELAAETYALVTDPEKLPMQLRAALAHHLRQPKLEMAAATGRYIATDSIGPEDRDLPIHRLILAGVGQRYAVVHYESGGYAASRNVAVFELTDDGVEVVWADHIKRRLSAPIEFERALKDGTLFDSRVAGPE